MQWLLVIAQAAPTWAHLPEPEPAEPNWALVVFVLLGSLAVQALFGWWAVMKAEEHDSNKIAAFFAGFFFLYMGVRMTPILRYDRIFNVPRAPRPLPPRQAAPLPPGFQPAGLQAPAQPPHATPQTQSPESARLCPACGAPRRAGRKSCMSCGATLPTES